MLNKILKFSLGNRLLLIVASVLLIIFGSYVAREMDVDVFPDLTAPTVVVLTEAHGMAAEEVEKLVSFPIEASVNGATNVRRVRSSSTTGFSIVWVEFEWNTDIFIARQIVNEKLSGLNGQLPEEVSAPSLAPQSSIMGEIMFISLSADSTSKMDLRGLADWTIRPRLLATGGVAQVSVMGGEQKQYQIQASPQRMKQYGVSLNELLAACRAANDNSSGGIINEYGNEYIVKGIGRTKDINELGRSPVKLQQGRVVKIEDVADIRIGSPSPIGDAASSTREAVVLAVAKQPSTNTLKLSEKIDLAMADIQKSLPPDVKLDTHVFRQSDFIEASIRNIRTTLIEGSLFVVIVLFLFLLNWRATLISLLAIPISLLTALLTLHWLGYTINTMSLGGMAIAIGALVDDAIIDVENVFRRLRQNAQLPEDQQKNKLQVVFDASMEIRSSIINATLIIIVAFVPLFFLSGMEGKLLMPLGIAFIVSIFSSLIVSITLTPVLSSYLLVSDRMLKNTNKKKLPVEKLQHLYGQLLAYLIDKKKWVLGPAILLFALCLFMFTQFGRSFLPEFNEGSLVVTAVSLPGISLEESRKMGIQVEKALLSIEEIKQTTRRTGRAEMDEHSQGVNSSEIEAPFELKDRSRAEFMEEVRAKLSGIAGVNISIGQPISHRIDHMLSGTRANIAIKIFGDDLQMLQLLSNQVKNEISGINGLVDVSSEQLTEVPQLQIKARREMLNHYGISMADFNQFVNVAIGGEKVSEIYEGGRSYDVILRFDESTRGSMESIGDVWIDAGIIPEESGEISAEHALMEWHSEEPAAVPLHYVADMVSSSGPGNVQRENVQRRTIVSANVSGRDQKSAVEEIKKVIEAEVPMPDGYHVEYGGQFEAEAQASRILLIASVLSLLIIFLLLYQEFKEWTSASIILLNLPLALIGGVFSVWFSGGVISIPAIIGFITLFGIASRNGILLVSHYKHLEAEGHSLNDVVIQGSMDRLSPILMTALTAGLALIPLALKGDLAGNEIQSPMAKVILGGLLSSTLLNIFIVPIVYLITKRSRK